MKFINKQVKKLWISFKMTPLIPFPRSHHTLTFRFWCGIVCLYWWHYPVFINRSLFLVPLLAYVWELSFWGASAGVCASPLFLRCLCLRMCANSFFWGASAGVCVRSNCKQVCALVSCVMELWVGNCRWHHHHKHISKSKGQHFLL